MLASVLPNMPLVPPLTVTSPVSNPLTSSEKVKVAWNVAVELIVLGTPEIATVGASPSQTAVSDTAAVGALLTPSVTAFAGTVTITSASPSGVTTSV